MRGKDELRKGKKKERKGRGPFICITCLLYVNRLFKRFYGDVTHVNLSFLLLCGNFVVMPSTSYIPLWFRKRRLIFFYENVELLLLGLHLFS